MKNLKQLLALLLALVMVVGVMAGCSGNEDTTPSDDVQASGDSTAATDDTTAPVEDGPQYGGHLNVKINVAPVRMDPLKQSGAVWMYQWTTCVFEGPLTRDAQNNIAPGVCDYELSDDQLTLKLWVRDNMVFSNGDPVDIYDVEASIKRAMAMYSSIISKVTPYVASIGVDADGKTLVINFSELREDCLYYLAAYQTWCSVMPKEICEKYAEDYIVDQIEDVIGTGPYKVTDFENGVQITITKRDDYIVQESDRTGFAGPKYGYLDSMTFWFNDDASSSSMGLFAGNYDVVESIASDYQGMMEQSNIVMSSFPSNTGCGMVFNTKGTENVCAKYPSLRKAIMAAVDYEQFLGVMTDGQATTGGGGPVLSDAYASDKFVNADYYGATNLEVAKKYMDEAKAEGWDGEEKVALVLSNARTDSATLLGDYLTKAGIPYEYTAMEASAHTEFIGDPNNLWDFYFAWPSYALTPTLLQAVVVTNNWGNERKDEILAEMKTLAVGSDEYMDLWDELVDIWVDDCASPYMGTQGWYWYHNGDLVANEDGALQRCWFNAYWTNPEEHQA